jgi:aerobic-type carbon monoxide dehydrogenase small subunit (CoxS/CutS family)
VSSDAALDVTIVVNGVPRRVAPGITLAVALWQHERVAFRHDSAGGPRGPFCAMGVCHECRVTVDGVAGVRSCLLLVRDGLVVEVAPA